MSVRGYDYSRVCNTVAVVKKDNTPSEYMKAKQRDQLQSANR